VTRVAYLDCIGGIAGDMLLAALVDAGASPERLTEIPSLLDIDAHVEVTRVSRQGVAALRVDVTPGGEQSHTPYAAIRVRVERSSLSGRARGRALDAFARLAAAEGRIHSVPADDVELHELGSTDTLVDVCGAMTLLDELAIDRVACSPLPYSRGVVPSRHGTLPVPAPATLELLVGAPLVGVDSDAELVTPTGAAIAAAVATSWGELPSMTLDAIGYGAGRRELPGRPNVLRVLLGEARSDAGERDVVLLETNLDDLNPELVPDAVERCSAAGALDVWVTPVQMKKGRPGIVLSALARAEREAFVAEAMLSETTTLGVRIAPLRRVELEREERTVIVAGSPVRIKVGRLDGRIVNVAPEHDDCVAVAQATGRSVKSIWVGALAAAESL
jgi:uncharacterized protein (TIGR00299 family) protein